MAWNDVQTASDNITHTEWNNMVTYIEGISAGNSGANYAYDYIVYQDGANYKAQTGSDGAIGSTDTNPRTVIQYAIDNIGTKNYNKILLNGDFTISSTITLIDNLDIELVGSINASANTVFFGDTPISNFSFHGGYISSNKDVATSDTRTEGVFYFPSSADHIRFRDIHFDSLYNNAISFYQGSGADYKFDNITFTNLTGYGVLINATNLDEYKRVNINNIDIYEDTPSLLLSTILVDKARDVNINNITVEKVSSDNPAVWLADSKNFNINNVTGYNCYDYPVSITSCKDGTISNIHAVSGQNWGAVIASTHDTGYDIENVTIDNVTASHCGRHGILFHNPITNCKEVKGLIISNFMIDSCDENGIAILALSGAVSGVRIHNGICKNNGQNPNGDYAQGIFVAGKKGNPISVDIRDVSCTDTQAVKTQPYGIMLNAVSSSGWYTNLTARLYNNYLLGNNTAPIYVHSDDDSTYDLTAEGNQGYYKSGTLYAKDIYGGDTSTAQITLQGSTSDNLSRITIDTDGSNYYHAKQWHFWYQDGQQLLRMNQNGTITEVWGQDGADSDLKLGANTSDADPYIVIEGAGNTKFSNASGFLSSNTGLMCSWISGNKTNLKSEYMVPIWAEENNTLSATTYEWAFGNGADTPVQGGILIYVPDGYECHVVAMGLNINDSSADACVELVHNGTPQGNACSSCCVAEYRNLASGFTPIEISNGDFINFRTLSASDTAKPATAVAWLRYRGI